MFKLTLNPGVPITEMKTGDIAQVVSKDHKGALIQKTIRGFVSLSNPTNPLGRLSPSKARVEIFPAGTNFAFVNE